MKADPNLTVNEQLEHLRRQVLGSIAAGFLVLFVTGFLAVHYYQKAQTDLQNASCGGRFALIRVMQHAELQVDANPRVPARQKAANRRFFNDLIAQVDVSDCSGDTVPQIPLVSR